MVNVMEWVEQGARLRILCQAVIVLFKLCKGYLCMCGKEEGVGVWVKKKCVSGEELMSIEARSMMTGLNSRGRHRGNCNTCLARLKQTSYRYIKQTNIL